MTYVIGIKKKLYGSDNEVVWRYASGPSEKPNWTKLTVAETFNGTADAEKWWAENGGKLLSDPNVIRSSVCVRKVKVEAEQPLPFVCLDSETAEKVSALVKAVADKFSEAKELLGDDDLFMKKFLTPVRAVYDDYAGESGRIKCEPGASAERRSVERQPRRRIEMTDEERAFNAMRQSFERLFGVDA